MKIKLLALFAGSILVCPVLIPTARAQDSWTNKVRGNFYKWEDGSKWSSGVPPAGTGVDAFITNNPTGGSGSPGQTINIDATTVLSNAINGCMTIHNLTLSTPSGINHNLLSVSNTGSTPLTFDTPNHLNPPSLFIEPRCTVSITNSTVFVSFLGGGRIFDDGILILNSGTVNASFVIWTNGQMTVNGGNITQGQFFFTQVDTNTGSFGTLTINGGSVGSISGGSLGCQTWLNGGTLSVPEDLDIDDTGVSGAGVLTVSNGVCQSGELYLGETGSGTLNLAGGVMTLGSDPFGSPAPTLCVAIENGSSGSIWMTGGQLTVGPSASGTNAAIIGYGGTGQMTVSNGQWTADGMLLGNGAIAHTFFHGGATFGSTGTLTLNGGTGSVYSNLIIGSDDCAGIGFVMIAGGSLMVTNVSHTGALIVHNGTLTMSGGTLSTDQALLTNFCSANLLITGSGSVWSNADIFTGGPAGVANLVVSNGAQIINTHDLNLGFTAGASVSHVVVTGSGTVWSNEFEISVGNLGAGNTLAINNGAVMVSPNASLGDNGAASTNNSVVVADSGSTWNTFVLDVGFNGSGNSMVISNGGTVFGTFAVLGSSPGANNNSVLVSGAGSTWSNGASIVIGNSGAGASVTVTNGGVVLARNVPIGEQSGGGGQLNVSAGGTMLVSSNVTLGNYSCSGTGNVVVTDGSLYVTNGAHSAVLEVRSGTFIMNSGTVVVDQFVITNACAHFIRNGGTLVYGSAILSSNLDADGDGIPNGYEQAHGLDPLNPADANLDNDGDGFSNLQEFLAGTDPNNAGSTPFVATSVANQGNNIVLTWTTLGGSTNQVQVANGSFATNAFVNLGAPLNISGVGLVTTNYIDVGEATNVPSRYYRVRLVP